MTEELENQKTLEEAKQLVPASIERISCQASDPFFEIEYSESEEYRAVAEENKLPRTHTPKLTF